MGGGTSKSQHSRQVVQHLTELDNSILPAKVIKGETPFGTKLHGFALLIIDPQKDFHEGGSLAVSGADEDTKRLTAMIYKYMHKFSQINVTLDSHHKLHIGHGAFWEDPKTGESPTPFTSIHVKDVKEQKWLPRRRELTAFSLNYLEKLVETKVQPAHVIWPDHCLIGSSGHNVMENLNEALNMWCVKALDTVNYVNKGTCCLSEMFSAFQGAVPVDNDSSTWYNDSLLNRLLQADRVLVAGQALSHCVNFSVRDLMSRWPKERMQDIWLMTDTCSSVTGFEAKAKEFLTWFTENGGKLTTTTTCFGNSEKDEE